MATDDDNLPPPPADDANDPRPESLSFEPASEKRGGNRREKPDRREGAERRAIQIDFEGPDQRQSVTDRRSGLDRRRGPGRRRSDDRRSAEEGEMTDEQFDFVLAINEYKKVNKRPFPTWTEVLDIIRALGYRKVEPEQDIE